MDISQLTNQAKLKLTAGFGSSLKGVILYGSYANGTAHSGSDIDLLVLLDKEVTLSEDLRTIIDSIYDLQLISPAAIHALPVNVHSYEKGEKALYRKAKIEGLFL